MTPHRNIHARLFSRIPGRVAYATLLLGILATALLAGVASAQSDLEWVVTLGGNGDDFAHAVALAADGGFVIAGETRSFGAGSRDGWLVKLDADGTQAWSRTYGGTENDIAFAVVRTSDGGYVLAGESASAANGESGKSNFWLVKVDSDGYEEWQRYYGNSGGPSQSVSATSGAAHAVRQTSDGGFILAGRSTGDSGTSIRLVKTDTRGAVQWSRTVAETPAGVAYDVRETASGDFLVAGNSDVGDSGTNALLMKVSSGGDTLWSKSFGGDHNDEARSLVIAEEGGYVLGGFTWSQGAGLSDFWLLRTDETGDQLWQRSFGGVPRDAAHALTRTSDGGFAMAGWSESFSEGDRFWVVKTDSSGQLQWNGAFPGASRTDGSGTVSSGARALQQTGDGGFIVAGWTGEVRGARDVMVVKTGPIVERTSAQSGASVVLENTGGVDITAAAVGFDSVFFGRPLRFWYDGRLIDQDNPLPRGEIACTLPAPALASGSRMVLDQIGSYEFSYLDSLAGSEETGEVAIDADGYNYDLNGLKATLKVVSVSPCRGNDRLPPEGPRAPLGLSGESSGSHPGTISLDWADNHEPDIFGYSVYVSRRPMGPFIRRAWLLPDSSYSDPGATDGASYYYSVGAINSWGLESPKSAVARITSTDFTPPSPPSGLQLTAFDRVEGKARLKWSPSPDADVSGYRIYRQDGDGPRTPVTALLFASEYEDLTLSEEGIFSYSATAIDLTGNESGWSNIAPPQLDFFGSVLEIRRNFIDEGILVVDTSRGRVDVEVVSGTEVRLPGRDISGLGDLTVGDNVAVSLESEADGTVARQVYLVPTKTRNRHLVGTVNRLSENEIVIQPRDENAGTVSFQLTDAVEVTFYQGGVELGAGHYVIASYLTADEETESALTEINVIAGPEPESTREPSVEPANVALIRGEFQGINPTNANIILSSTEIGLNAGTQMTAGVSVGDAVLVEAELLADGRLLALRMEHDEGTKQIAARTVLRGAFQGRDAATGRWTVSGVPLTVDRHTYTDSLPSLGQRVKVSAIVRDDGSLYSREIENLPEKIDPDAIHTVLIEGLFSNITAQGAWTVGGVPVRVDADTVLSGRPSVGRRVNVTASGGSGDLLSVEVSAAAPEQDGLVRSVSIRGTVDRMLKGQWLIVDGFLVVQSELTKVVGNVAVGSSVRLKAELQGDGELLAREVALSASYDETGETRANPVDIEGRIERVDPGGDLVVNGIPVATSALTKIDATLQIGSTVQIRGILQRDGSVLAREIVGYGPGITSGTKASVSGVVESVTIGSGGNVISFVVDGISVMADGLTRMEVDLIAGVAVVVQAIVVNGDILAVTVEPRPSGSIGVLPSVQMQGTIERPFASPSPFPVDIVVNGITVRIAGDTEIIGAISGGAVVKVSGSISGGIFLARKIESVRSLASAVEERVVRFILRGAVEEIRVDDEENPEAMLMAGNLITIVPLTIFQDDVSVGDSIVAQGIIRDGVLLAALIKLEE